MKIKLFRLEIKLVFMNNSFVLLELKIHNNQILQLKWKSDINQHCIFGFATVKTNYLNMKQ